jgi:AcrR family transcriptional regulator
MAPSTTSQTNGKELPWRGDPLPRGRHKLRRKDVRNSQRDRLVRAMRECVAANGYAQTSIADVAAAARVSPNRFYAFFRDKADCFLAVCDQDASELLGELFRMGAGDDWVEDVRRGMRIYLNWWRDRPQASRAFLLEMPSVGEPAQRQREEVHARFEAMFAGLAARARKEQPDLAPMSPLALRIFIAGMTEMIATEVRAGRIDGLPGLEDELVALLVTLLADDATGARRA